MTFPSSIRMKLFELFNNVASQLLTAQCALQLVRQIKIKYQLEDCKVAKQSNSKREKQLDLLRL